MKAALAVVVAIGMAVGAATWAGIWLGLLSFVVVIGSVHGFLFPVWYQVTEDALVVRSILGAQKRPWSTLRRVDAGRNGAHLSPFSVPTRLDGTRGIYVRFEGNREEVIEVLTRMVEAAHEDESGRREREGAHRAEGGEHPARHDLRSRRPLEAGAP